DLDAPVQKYCPQFPQKQWPINARQLLSHLSGVRHYHADEDERTHHYASLTEALGIFKDDALQHEPGTKMTYTTYGYTLLGCVIEGASGISYADYVRENVFKPAGMNTARTDDIFDIIPNRAQGYGKTTGGALRNRALDDTSYKIPGGGLCASVEDLAKFAVAVQNGTLVKQETFTQMTTRQKTRDGKEINYGLGWSIDRPEGRRGAIWHGGAQQGATTDFYILPKERFALVFLTNLEGGGRLGLGALAAQIADIVLQ
ncbi:MAG TPA: serine hydrolase domain-containing protein, partial [Pyrinomonadaceae bacterium]|nr:serine hydrolase domain-containing protein [Pyrinomonadaceae bacterium]